MLRDDNYIHISHFRIAAKSTEFKRLHLLCTCVPTCMLLMDVQAPGVRIKTTSAGNIVFTVQFGAAAPNPVYH